MKDEIFASSSPNNQQQSSDSQNGNDFFSRNESVNSDEFTLAELRQMELTPPQFIVEGLFQRGGVTVLAGAPKSGKSTISAMIAISVARGEALFNQFNVQQGKVLYLSLEDSLSSLSSRDARLFPADIDDYCEKITFLVKWGHQGKNAIKALDDLIAESSGFDLVIVDTLGMFFGQSDTGRSSYTGDYRRIIALKRLAEQHDIGLITIHHTLKKMPDDWVSGFYGSFGIAGAVDTISYFERERGSRISRLHVTGREIEDNTIPLEIDRETGLWVPSVDNDPHRLGIECQEIFSIIQGSPDPLKLNQISAAVGKRSNTVSKHIQKLIRRELVKKTGHGFYQGVQQEQGVDEDEMIDEKVNHQELAVV